MIICNREEANKLISSQDNLLKDDERNNDIVSDFLNYEIKEIKRGRGEVLDIGEERRKEIATLALTSGLSIEEVAKLTGVSPQSVSAYKHGATSEATYNKKDESLGEHVDGIKTQVSNAAQNKLMMAIEALTGEKIHGAKARDIAGIAKDMSAIMKNMTPDGPLVQNNKVLIYQPRVKEEDDFITVEALD